MPNIEEHMPHPDKVHESWHNREAIFWELQNRHGVPGFHCDRHSWTLFDSDFTKAVQDRTKPAHAIYVRAYEFGRYPEIYEAMEAVGARVISLQEADDLVAAGETIPDVVGDPARTNASKTTRFFTGLIGPR